MRKIIFSLILLATLLTSFISAEIIIGTPNDVYNLGEEINIPLTITTNADIGAIFTPYLICDKISKEVYPKMYIPLKTREEKKLEINFELITEIIGGQKGTCVLKGVYSSFSQTSSEFTLSKLINIDAKLDKEEINPNEEIILSGTAIKENGKEVDGIVEIEIPELDILLKDTIKEGRFEVKIKIPSDAKAGLVLLNVNAYEKDRNEEITNEGFISYNFRVNQIPTNLEIILEQQEIEPGSSIQVKARLHDQTGETMDSVAILTIKNSEGKILNQQEVTTEETLEYNIESTESPSTWSIFAVSNKIQQEAEIKIKELEKIQIDLINKTLIITNVGNVVYNKTVPVKIGEQTIQVETILNIGETKKYLLSAPQGEYQIEVEGVVENVMLTGNSISAREISEGLTSIARHPASWIFLLIILALGTYLAYKKGYKKIILGKNDDTDKKKLKINENNFIPASSQVLTQNKAEMALSIEGTKQNATVVCLKIKDRETLTQEHATQETIQKIINNAEKKGAITYESLDNLYFIFAPMKTKQLQNEVVALTLAKETERELYKHNKMFRQKIDSGISINSGQIVAKQTGRAIKFMSIGTFTTLAKKLADISKGELLLGEITNSRLNSKLKTKKESSRNVSYYSITEIKPEIDSKSFISNFVKKYEGN